MWVTTLTRHHVQASNFISYVQPLIHYDRIMEVHDLIYMEKGEWEIYEEGTPYLLQDGDVLSLEAGRHHYGLRPCQAGTKTIFIHVYAEAEDGKPSGASLSIPTLIKAGSHNLQESFARLANTWWMESADRDLRISAQLDLLFCDMAAAGRTGVDGLAWPVDAVHQLLLKNPSHNYSLSELAKALNLSERYLRYIFQRTAGQPIHQYQLNLKLKMAKQLLAVETWHSLADIAATFGFCDEYHFSRMFKRLYGISPGTFKKHH